MFPLFSPQPTELSTVLQVLMQRLCRDSGPRRATCSLWWPLPALTCLSQLWPVVGRRDILPASTLEVTLTEIFRHLAATHHRHALNCCNIAAYSHLFFFFFFIAVTNDHDFWLHWPVWTQATSLTLRNNFVPRVYNYCPHDPQGIYNCSVQKKKERKKKNPTTFDFLLPRETDAAEIGGAS